MLTPHGRRRADSGNVTRHTRRDMRAMGVACKQPASNANVKTMEEDGMEGALFVQQNRKTDWKWCQCLEWVCKDHSIKTIQIQITCDSCKEQSY